MVTEELYIELKKITEEESRILNGGAEIEKDIYMSQETDGKDGYVIDAKKLLDAGKVIQVRPHTRFIHFSKHTHNYIEVIYMCSGSTHHVVDGDDIWLKEGFTKEIALEQFTGCVLYSDLEQTGWITTSSDKVNQLIQNAMWGQKCNYVDIPTDCPQRDERMGWTADTQVFSGTACFNMDSYNFLRKFSHDLYETQKEYGHVTSVIPAFHENGPTCSVWGDAATVVPWNLYLYYGDINILKEQFESMRQWVDYIKGIDDATGGRRRWDVGFHFGDWLALDGEGDDGFKGATEDGYIATAYYYHSASIVAKAAKLLGRKEEASYYGTLAEEIKAALQAEYFTANGRLALTTQTAYAVALYMDFAPEGSKERIADFLKEKLKINKGYLKIYMQECMLQKSLVGRERLRMPVPN